MAVSAGAQSRQVRVAVAQFATGTDGGRNLERCLAAVAAASTGAAWLLVLPEFCNYPSWYDDADHCREVALELEGDFLSAIAEAASTHNILVVVNCTLRRKTGVTGTSLLYSPQGELLSAADKQVLIGHENDFLQPARQVAPIVNTDAGRVATYACMDGVICETPRSLALRGAQLLCNSLNSFARDEAALHVPVRAAENRVFVAAANKVGALIPEEQLEAVSQAVQIPAEYLSGAGESQVVAPDGRVLVRAPRQGEAVVWADLCLEDAADKTRPDGTDRFASRRPELYRPIAQDPAEQAPPAPAPRREMSAAVALPPMGGWEALHWAQEQLREASRLGVELVVLPELFCFDAPRMENPEVAAQRFDAVVAALAQACGAATFAVASLVRRRQQALYHEAVLVGAAGLVAAQPQLHPCRRHHWAALGEGVITAQLPFGCLGLVLGDDSIQPEVFRLLAIAGAQVVAAPMSFQEAWELEIGLVERAAENRINLVAACAPGDAGLLVSLPEDFTLMTPWRERSFDGFLSQPLVTPLRGSGLHRATLHPAAAANKLVSHRTHLLEGRPWQLCGAITRPQESAP